MKFSLSNYTANLFQLSWIIFLLINLFLISCNPFFSESTALEKLNAELSKNQSQNYSIILKDMGSESNADFWHIYEIMQFPNANQRDVVMEATPKYRVSAEFFEKHIDHLGMELCYNIDGKITYAVSAIGFNHLVGNSTYGKFMTVEEAQEQGIIQNHEIHNDQEWSSNLSDTSDVADSTKTHARRRSFLGSGMMWFFMGRYMGMNTSFGTKRQPITQAQFSQHQAYRQGQSATPYKRPLSSMTTTPNSTTPYGKNWNSLPPSQKTIVKKRASSVAKTRRTQSSLRKRSSGFGK